MSASPRVRKWPVILVALGLHLGVFALLASNQRLYDALFAAGPTPAERPISASRLSEICADLQRVHADRWRDRGGDLDAVLAELRAERRVLWDRIAARRGDAELADLERLLATVAVPDTGGPATTAGLSGVFRSLQARERRIHHVQVAILAGRFLLQEHPRYTPVEAVSLVQVVAPQRWSIDPAAADGDVRDREALLAFREQVDRGTSEIEAMCKHAEQVLASLARQAGDRQGVWTMVPELEAGSRRGATLRPDELDPFAGSTSLGSFTARPGRQLAEEGRHNDHLFIDRWYVMGPFDNRLRRNLQARFLPELGVDLNATTRGKDGRTLHWEYWVSDDIRIEPRFAEREAVYYGWSELRVPTAGSYFVSLGSDDFGKLWINGEEVWQSGVDPKPYRVDEAGLWVELEAGVNEVLFRCENFGGTMGWSVVLMAGAAADEA